MRIPTKIFMLNTKKCFWIIVISLLSSIGVIGASLEPNTSISHAYGARNVWVNPAALAFDTELNGSGLLGAFSYGFNRVNPNELSASLSYGYLGMGYEQLSIANTSSSHFAAALGLPLSSNLFLGTRYRLTRFSDPLADRVSVIDLGLQVRALQNVSIGLQVNSINQPLIAGKKHSADFVAGSTVRLLQTWDLSLDVTTPSDAFLKKFGYRLNTSVEFMRGVRAYAGYGNVEKWSLGIELNWSQLSLFSITQEHASGQRIITGVQISSKPRAQSIRSKSSYTLEVDSSLGEEGMAGGFFNYSRPSLLDLIQALDQIQNDPMIVSVSVRLDSFPLGLAAAQDFRDAIHRCRNAGKHVEVFLKNAGIKEYLIASSANKIHMAPSAELRFLGPKSEKYYFKGTLDKVGVEGQFLARGKYKSAPEIFTRSGSSPLNREETLLHINEVEKKIISILNEDRAISGNKWNEVLKVGLFDAPSAKKVGLVDCIEPDWKHEEEDSFPEAKTLYPRTEDLVLPPRIAVIVAEGDIVQKRIGLFSLVGGRQITPGRMESLFEKALRDARTKAIIFRVSSPGGEVLASSEIANLVERARSKNKLVISSMGDVAASGGYMISAPTSRIFAQDLSLTGSIGVFLGKFNFSELYKKIDLHKEILSKAPYAGLLTEDRSWTNEEKGLLTNRLNQYYDSFVSYVAEKRHLSNDEVEAAAQGRVWLGEQAVVKKIVDQKGGYYDAIQYAALQSGLKPGQFETWLVEENQSIFGIFDPQKMLSSHTDLLANVGITPLLKDLEWMTMLERSPYLYWSQINRIQ